MYQPMFEIFIIIILYSMFLYAVSLIEQKIDQKEGLRLGYILLFLTWMSSSATIAICSLFIPNTNILYHSICFIITLEVFIQCGAFKQVHPTTTKARISHAILPILYLSVLLAPKTQDSYFMMWRSAMAIILFVAMFFPPSEKILSCTKEGLKEAVYHSIPAMIILWVPVLGGVLYSIFGA